MELILVVVISAGMAENSQNGVSRSLNEVQVFFWFNLTNTSTSTSTLVMDEYEYEYISTSMSTFS